ncbi:MAG: hypothetical protein V7L05_01175 [Nostoc sp.]|uniref:hypothetical protein n=1 Tax=Nostoc sp. TaxID=1180 RepID=UPI002FF80E21
MKISDALANVSRLFLDTAPVIYFVERNPQFVDLVDPIFDRLEADITAVASAITLSECLVGAIVPNHIVKYSQTYATRF